MNTLNEIAVTIYGKNYTELADDGIEQDFIQGEFEKQNKQIRVCSICGKHYESDQYQINFICGSDCLNKKFNINELFRAEDEVLENALENADFMRF